MKDTRCLIHSIILSSLSLERNQRRESDDNADREMVKSGDVGIQA